MRPTAALVRESLFNIIGSGIGGSSVLDLCAGSGSVGIEALSRGAASCVFVDNHQTSVSLIHRNLEELGLKSRSLVFRRSAVGVVAELGRRTLDFDVVFFDPPYDSDIVLPCLRSSKWRAIMRARGRVFIEHRRDLVLPPMEGWREESRRTFGETVLMELRGEPGE
jgi:16S rRNA (guanine966-N2)-methyltransferase